MKAFRTFTTTACLLLIAVTGTFAASPVDFALAEVRSAIESRQLGLRVVPELSPALAEEAFQITGANVLGGSPRGLMYGLLTAAGQLRASGRLAAVKAEPVAALRGLRRVMTTTDWQQQSPQWLDFFSTVARARFNRVHLVLDEPLTRERLESLKLISEAAQERAIDLVIGLRDPQAVQVGALLASCPAVKAVYTDPDSAVYISGPISQAGRYVVLETSKPIVPAVPVPLRVSTPAGKPLPACGASCEHYLVFPPGAPVPPSFAGLAGVELQGDIPSAWASALYPVRATPARAKPARTRRRK